MLLAQQEEEGDRKRRRLFCSGEEEEGMKKRDNEFEDKLLVEQNNNNESGGGGDGVVWFRGAMIGKGSFGSVYLATLKNPNSRYSSFPPVMAVKSAEVSVSGSIQKEKEVLNNIRGCPNVIRCFGEETTNGANGEMVYNLLLEYGSGGTLADLIKKSGQSGGLPEFDVRCYTRSILHGLRHIHDCSYVHCDLKPENILLVPNNTTINGGGACGAANLKFRAKIGDLGLAKRAKQSKKSKMDPYWRGTPMYLSPEAVIDSVQEPPCDIWAIGCIVLEMLTGEPPWNSENELDARVILRQIGEENELPMLPSTISKEGRSFLKGCFVRKPMYRLTAEMLLNHPFVEGLVDDNEVEEVQEVSDINSISSLLVMSETDDDEDEHSLSYFSDEWSYDSEDEFSSWSEEEYGGEPNLEAQESGDVRSDAVEQFRVPFTISAGV